MKSPLFAPRAVPRFLRLLALTSAMAACILLVVVPNDEAMAGHSDQHDTPYLWAEDVIASNVLTGDTIDVCSEDFPHATMQAVTIWNVATGPYVTDSLFAFHDTVSMCTGTDSTKIAHVIVKHTPVVAGVMKPCNNADAHVVQACVAPLDGIANSDQSLFGRLEIRVQGDLYDTAADSASSDYFDNLVTYLAHELGHVVGLQHYGCNPGTTPPSTELDPRTKLHNAAAPAIMYNDTGGTPGLRCHVLNAGHNAYRITDIDIADFLVAYYGVPGAPTDLMVANANGGLRLAWRSPQNIHKADTYQYRLDAGEWVNIPVCNAETTTHFVDDLDNGTSYTVEVRTARGPVESDPSAPRQATPTAESPVDGPGSLDIAVDSDSIAGDGIVNLAEKAAGFELTGTTQPGASVSVEVGSTQLSEVVAEIDGTWLATVGPQDSSSIGEGSLLITATASNTGCRDGTVSATINVDLTAPSVSYDLPESLSVASAINLMPTTEDTDIVSYALAASSRLAAGLTLDGTTGAIAGTPTDVAMGLTALIVITDRAGNASQEALQFPAVGKGAQTLSGFAYTPSSVTIGSPAPVVTPPSGAVGALSYGSEFTDKCTVDNANGALTVLATGTCTIVATAAMTANYHEATAQASVSIRPRSTGGGGTDTGTPVCATGQELFNGQCRPTRPLPVVSEEQVGRTIADSQWRLFADGVPGAGSPDQAGTCYWILYQKDRYALAEFETSYRWNGSQWVLDPATKMKISLESDYIYTDWYATTNRFDTSCPGSGDGARGARSAPTPPPAGARPPGDYVVASDGAWYRYTIPNGANVTLQLRTVDARAELAFSLPSGAEVAVVPSQLASDPPETDDPTLAAIVRSFRLEDDPARLPPGAENRTCAEAPSRDDVGALSLDLDAQWCAVVRGGGAVTVSLGTDQLALTLSSARGWLVFAAPQSRSIEAAGIWVVERQSRSHLILDPATGSELARHIPEGNTDLPALFDAMIPAARANNGS